MSNILTDSQQQTLHGYSFWMKFFCVLNFIAAGVTIAIGVPLIVALGTGLLVMALGGFIWWLTLKLWRTAKQAQAMEEAAALSAQEGLDQSVAILENFRSYLKITGIIMIVYFALSIVGTIAIIAGGLAFGSVLEDELNDNPTVQQALEEDRELTDEEAEALVEDIFDIEQFQE